MTGRPGGLVGQRIAAACLVVLDATIRPENRAPCAGTQASTGSACPSRGVAAVMDLVDSYREAQQHLAARDAAAALSLLERVAAHVPEDRSVLRLLALARYGTGDVAAAEVVLRHVVAADPVDADAHALLGEVLAAGGDDRGAAAERAIAGQLSPRYAASCEVWGRTG